MATLRDVARMAAVSTATVSNVLNDALFVSPELRKRVLAAASQLGYRPNALAKSLRVKRSLTIGMVVPDITDPFFPAVVRGAEDVLSCAGYTLIIGNSDNDPGKEEAYYRTFIDRRVDGLLTVPTRDEAPEVLKGFQEQGIPVVHVDRTHVDMLGDVVTADHLEGSRLCVEHLLETGRRRIATITGPLQLSNARARLEGYQRALKEAQLPIDKRLIREGAFDIESGRLRSRELLSVNPRPDAIFVANAPMALGVLQVLEEDDIECPKEISVACFDHLEVFDMVRPRLTCVAAPSYELGALAAKLILKRISGSEAGPAQRHLLATKLVRRESTGVVRPVPVKR